MKKILSLALVVVMVVFCFTGCDGTTGSSVEEPVIPLEPIDSHFYVWVDPDTGVNYIVNCGGYGIKTITPRLNVDGTVIITKLP